MRNITLVVDCGSTKCDWRSISKSLEISEYQTVGFNPNYMEGEKFSEEIVANKSLMAIAKDVEAIYFYGSGCKSTSAQNVVSAILKKEFANANISVESDLLAAARACYQGEPVICSILGTGSISCLYDGHEIKFAAPSLGYVLGDDGSGNKIGQRLLRDYYYQLMPLNMATKFKVDYALEIDDLIANVYQKPRPNAFLASFAKFAFNNSSDPYIHNIVKSEFEQFLRVFVCKFENYQNLKTNFVGSIAWHFKEELLECCNNLDIQVGKILQKPIDELTQYHLLKISLL